MASYQVPQFLDSGDKILGPLNLRQFGYALGGFLSGVVIYSFTNALFPELGVLSWTPAVPVIMIAAFLALGKYNGRDGDVYFYKFILYVLKARVLSYNRVPYLEDLDQKMGEWTYQKISKRWTEETSQRTSNEGNEYSDFQAESAEAKAEKIRRLGTYIDKGVVNAMTIVEQKKLAAQAKEALLRDIRNKNMQRPRPHTINPDARPLPDQVVQTGKISDPAAQNLFNASKPNL